MFNMNYQLDCRFEKALKLDWICQAIAEGIKLIL